MNTSDMKFVSLRKAVFSVLVISLFGFLFVTTSAMAGEKKLDLSQYHGKVVYLDFWASWCGPCQLSFPFMEGLTHSYSKNDLVVVTVNLDRSHKAATDFLRKAGSNLTVIYDEKGDIARAYKVSDMPTSIVIGRDGKTRFTHKGFHPDQKTEYRNHINQLINAH